MNKILFTDSDLLKYTSLSEFINLKNDFAISSICTDSREDCSGKLFLALRGDNFDGHDYLERAVASGATALCVNSEYANLAERFDSIATLVVPDTLKAYQELARAKRLSLPDLKVIAVTGSSGKTSAKEILRAIFSIAYGEDKVYATVGNTNNHIGVPQNLLSLNEKHRVAIIEMGSNHHGEISVLTKIAEPDAAIITSIGPCHLEFFGDLAGVATEKSSIFQGLPATGSAVFPYEAAHRDILEKAASPFKSFSFGTSPEVDVRAKYLGGELNGSKFELQWRKYPELTHKVNWSLTGAHQANNAAACAAVANAMGLSPDIIAKGLSESKLPGLRTRIQEINGVTWVNDAYNANPASMKAGLAWLAEFTNPERSILALGDMLELGAHEEREHREILEYATELFPKAAIFAIGPRMSLAAKQVSKESSIQFYQDAQDAISPILERLQSGDLVFLKASRGMSLERIESAVLS